MKDKLGIQAMKFADGMHYYWKDKEIAVINNENEIEWCVRTHTLPQDVAGAVRQQIHTEHSKWLLEVRRNRISTTRGFIDIYINKTHTGISFEDKIVLTDRGTWESTISDENLGKYIISAFWHPMDDIYQHSDRFKDIFYPDWRKENES